MKFMVYASVGLSLLSILWHLRGGHFSSILFRMALQRPKTAKNGQKMIGEALYGLFRHFWEGLACYFIVTYRFFNKNGLKP